LKKVLVSIFGFSCACERAVMKKAITSEE